MKTKVLVSGYIGFNNFGDEAIFYCLSRHLKALGFEVCAICNKTEEIKAKYNVDVCYYKNLFEIIKNIFNTNILISGGGSLLQNKTSNFSLYYYLFIIFLSKIFFKKVIIFAQGIEQIKGKLNKFVLKNILKKADYISVRDINSYNLLKKNNINSTLVSDPVYSIIQDTDIEKEKSGLIVQLRSFKGIDENFLNNLAETISLNYSKENIQILSLQDEYDKEVCLKFLEKLKNLNIKAEFIPQKDIQTTINIINKAKYMISARLHGIIVSQGLNTKTFALIYDDKVRTIAEELDIENIDIEKYSKEEFQNKIKEFFISQNNTKSHRQFTWDEFDKKINEYRGKNE